jgi:hypothetical protein
MQHSRSVTLSNATAEVDVKSMLRCPNSDDRHRLLFSARFGDSNMAGSIQYAVQRHSAYRQLSSYEKSTGSASGSSNALRSRREPNLMSRKQGTKSYRHIEANHIEQKPWLIELQPEPVTSATKA